MDVRRLSVNSPNRVSAPEAPANSPPAQLRDGGSTSFSIAKPALQSANGFRAHFSVIEFYVQTRTNIYVFEDLYYTTICNEEIYEQ